MFLTVISLAVAEASSVSNNKAVFQSSFGRMLSWTARCISSSFEADVFTLIYFLFFLSDATAVGNIANVASIAWACALQIMAAAMIGSGFMFQPSTAQT